MKKALLSILMLVLLAGTAFAWSAQATLTGGAVADNTTVTITLPSNAGGTAYLMVPTIESATIVFAGSYDDSTYLPIWYYSNGASIVAFATGSTTGVIAIKLPDLGPFRKIKVTLGTPQSTNRVFIITGK